MKRIMRPTVFAVFAAALAAFLAIISPVKAAERYSVSNNTVFHNGSPITLKGVNWFGMESHPSVYTFGGLHIRDYKDMITQIKQVGFNSVRIPVCPATLDNLPTIAITFENGKNADLNGKKSLEVLDAVVNEMNRQQIYVLLDHHRIDCQSIPQLWYSDSYPESEWISDLTMMATRYSHLEYFMGIDLKNEPHGSATWGTGNQSTDWNTAAEKAGAAVYAANPNLLIFVEGVQDNPSCTSYIGHWMGGNIEPIDCWPISTAKIPAHKLVLSPHVYGPDVYMQPYFNGSSFPGNMPEIWEQHFGQYVQKGYTIIPGEWGGKYGNGGDPRDKVFQDSLVDYFISKKICNSYYWDWNPNSTDTGGVLKDDWTSVWDNKVAMLQRYFNSCQPNSTTPAQPIPVSAPTSNQPPSQPVVNGSGSNVIILAAGTQAAGVYPTAELVIGGQTVKTFSNIQGQPEQGVFETFSYNHPSKLNPSEQIEVKYVNDEMIHGQDRNLRVDKVLIDNQPVETEGASTYSRGSWDATSGCEGGYKNSEWLHCNGSFTLQANGTIPSQPNVEPVVTPSPIPGPTPQATVTTDSYRVEYFNGRILAGSPIDTASVATIDNFWGGGSPSSRVPQDNFSARYTKTVSTDSGTYRFRTTSDDGVLVYVDNRLVIDQWNDHATTVHEGEIQLTAGNHDIRVEYYENGGEAVIKFEYEKAATVGAPARNVTPIKVYAAGTQAGGVYPTLALFVNNQELARFEGIEGRPDANTYTELVYESAAPVQGVMRLEYLNDGMVGSSDRNLKIDKVVVGERVFELENPDVFSIGSWSSSNGCGEGFKASEWLHCNGHFSFSL